MKITRDEIVNRIANFPGAHTKNNSPICCTSTICKDLKFDIDNNTGKSDIVAIVTSSEIDGEGEVVVSEGLDPTYFRQNKSVFSDHDHTMKGRVGFLRALKLVQLGDGTKAWRARIGMHSLPLSRDIITIAQESGSIGLSIGFIPLDYGHPTPKEVTLYGRGSKRFHTIVRTAKWIETSLTPFPANVTSRGVLVMDQSQQDEAKGLIDNLLSRGMIGHEVSDFLGYDSDELVRFAVITPGGLIRGTKQRKE